MYIIKNAFRSISRSKGRNILIGIIALVIAVSACVALSIRESAVKAKEDALAGLNITAEIAYDRTSALSEVSSKEDFDPSEFKNNFSQTDTNLSIDEMLTYSGASTVDSFYYVMTASLNSDGSVEPYEQTSQSSSSNSSSSQSTFGADGNIPGNKGGFSFGNMTVQGDFSLKGYSSDEAMTQFGTNGTYSITDGQVFSEGTSELDCIISDELALLNNLAVGDTITLTNPNYESETYTLTICGIYNNSSAVASNNPFNNVDSANNIYLSYNALSQIISLSSENAVTDDDGKSSALTSTTQGTYTFSSVENYNTFCDEVRTMGLSEDYTVSSSDVESYEQSLLPLENLSTMAMYFLIVVFAIGAIIMVVLNIFNIRERKYEVGVLCAIGMKKRKVAAQFMLEIFIITLIAILLGTALGACISVPVSNKLLAAQIESNTQQSSSVTDNFGRDAQMPSGDRLGNANQSSGSSMPSTQGGGKFDMSGAFGTKAIEYVSSVSYATNLTVVAEMVGIGLLLTLVSSLAAVLFIMRYEPMKILSNRD